MSEAFAPAEARRILRRLQLHYTPKHASWLNMVEIEIGALRCRCLDRRINDPKRALSVSLPHGRNSATPPAPKSSGCSRPTKPAPKWAAPIPIRPKSHNHCAEILGTPVPIDPSARRNSSSIRSPGREHAVVPPHFHQRVCNQRKPKKLKTASTMTTAPTSQIKLFMGNRSPV